MKITHSLAFLLLTPAAMAQGPLTEIGFAQFGSSIAFGGYVAPDAAGGAYLAGSDSGQLGGQSFGSADVILARVDAAGNTTWIEQFGSARIDRAYAVLPDGAGGVFVSGDTQGDLAGPLGGLTDAYLARYDDAGTQLWVLQLGSDRSDTLRALAPDGMGGAFALGQTSGSYASPNLGGSDGIIVRFDAVGNILWSVQFGTSSEEMPQGMAADGAGGIFVVGTTGGTLPGATPGSGGAFLARFDANGALSWARQFGASLLENPRAVTADGMGGAFVTGTTVDFNGSSFNFPIDSFVARFDAGGTRLWTTKYTTADPLLHTSANAVAALPSGDVLVAGTTLLGDLTVQPGVVTPTDGFIHRLSPLGAMLTTETIGTPDHEMTVSIAPNGNAGVWVGGTTSGALGGPSQGIYDFYLGRFDFEVGSEYCAPAIPNSTGQPARITVAGSGIASDNVVTLVASDLPPNQFGYFLNSTTTALVPNAGGSQGTLCLGGSVGRYNGPLEIGASGDGGQFQLALDLTATPTPTGLVSILSGQTWHFQAWYRDGNPTATTNFTSAASVTFL